MKRRGFFGVLAGCVVGFFASKVVGKEKPEPGLLVPPVNEDSDKLPRMSVDEYVGIRVRCDVCGGLQIPYNLDCCPTLGSDNGMDGVTGFRIRIRSQCVDCGCMPNYRVAIVPADTRRQRAMRTIFAGPKERDHHRATAPKRQMSLDETARQIKAFEDRRNK